LQHHLCQLQGVLNAAARLIMHKRKYDSISSTVQGILHWILLRHRVEFKMCILVYNCLHNISPSCLSIPCQPVSVNPGLDTYDKLHVVTLLCQPQEQSAIQLSQYRLHGTVCRHCSMMTNRLSLHFAICSRLNTSVEHSYIRPSLSMLVTVFAVRVGKH